MKLGQLIIGGKPMRIPGIVDVYQRGNQWLARAWPRKAVQPNSAAQLACREKYRTAQKAVSGFTGQYKQAWTEIHCTPDKCWIDVARSSALKDPSSFEKNWFPDSNHIHLYTSKDYQSSTDLKYFLFMQAPDYPTPDIYNDALYRRGSSWEDVMRWNDNGWICPKGKRPKKKWDLSLKTEIPYDICEAFAADLPGPCLLWLMPDLPEGITYVGMNFWNDTETGEAKWSLYMPPVYFKPLPWPYGHIT